VNVTSKFIKNSNASSLDWTLKRHRPMYTAQPEPPQAVARLREILIEELPLRS
jgi:hypothetical protein